MKPVFPLLTAVCLAFARLSAAPAPTDWVQPPVTVVSEEVKVSVGEKLSLVVGRYWYQYVAKFDDPSFKTLAIYYPAFVSSELTEFRDLVDATQVKLMLGDREFRPTNARLLSDAETGPVQTLPHGTAIVWYTFEIPREMAERRFDVVISHYQPHYDYEGKTVAAYWPWMPNLEALRQPLELLDKNFHVTFQALPGVSFQPLSTLTHVEKDTPERLVVNPLHEEIIAVRVIAAKK